jgi:hypothetical protein
MNPTTGRAAGTQKVRREALGGERAEGWKRQREDKRVRGADSSALRIGKPDASLSGLGGLAGFNAFVQQEGLGKELRGLFEDMKVGRRVVYPMHTQIRLLIDGSIAGATRVFDFEWLAAGPLFCHLAGGAVPSIDTVYDDLRRFGATEFDKLRGVITKQGLLPVQVAGMRDISGARVFAGRGEPYEQTDQRQMTNHGSLLACVRRFSFRSTGREKIRRIAFHGLPRGGTPSSSGGSPSKDRAAPIVLSEPVRGMARKISY